MLSAICCHQWMVTLRIEQLQLVELRLRLYGQKAIEVLFDLCATLRVLLAVLLNLACEPLLPQSQSDFGYAGIQFCNLVRNGPFVEHELLRAWSTKPVLGCGCQNEFNLWGKLVAGKVRGDAKEVHA